MARDAETGEMLTDSDLWHSGYAVGYLLRERAAVYCGFDDDLSAGDEASLMDGYDAGVRDREEELAARAAAPGPEPAALDEIPY